MNLEILKIIISAAIPLVLFYFGYRFERNQSRKERRHNARIQFELEATFFGPQQGQYIVEIVVVLHNKGLVRNIIDELNLKALGIENDTAIELRKKDKKEKKLELLANFSKELIATDMLQKRNEKDSFFVEPGVVQKFTYVARIPDKIRFILVTSSFKYHDKSEHSAKRIFEVKPHKAPDKK
jgi:hypothetical protein